LPTSAPPPLAISPAQTAARAPTSASSRSSRVSADSGWFSTATPRTPYSAAPPTGSPSRAARPDLEVVHRVAPVRDERLTACRTWPATHARTPPDCPLARTYVRARGIGLGRALDATRGGPVASV